VTVLMRMIVRVAYITVTTMITVNKRTKMEKSNARQRTKMEKSNARQRTKMEKSNARQRTKSTIPKQKPQSPSMQDLFIEIDF
jgi:hypothetical protein